MKYKEQIDKREKYYNVNFLNISLKMAYEFSLKKRISRSEFHYIFVTCRLVSKFYFVFPEDEKINNMFRRSIEIFNRTMNKTNY